MRLKDNTWTPWLPDPDHLLFNEFKELQTASFAEAYACQKRLLGKLEDKDAFVASYSCIENRLTERKNTYCVWTSGITSWLPRTDWIAFSQILDGNTKHVNTRGIYEWDRVAQVMGHQIEPLDAYPVRYEVTGFPSDEQFAAFGQSLFPTAGDRSPVTNIVSAAPVAEHKPQLY